MKHITTDDLKNITREGLVLQGCGGDPGEWLTGINDLLTEAGILRDGGTFKDAYVFEHDGHTNILFSMEDVKLDIGKLAMWRLQTHSNFGGMWLSDFLPNRLGVEMKEREENTMNHTIDHSFTGTEIIHGDTLHVLKSFPDKLFGGILTDPPYASGAADQTHTVRETDANCFRFPIGGFGPRLAAILRGDNHNRF